MNIRIKVAAMVGIVVVAPLYGPDLAWAGGGDSSRLTVGGSPLSSLVRTEPMAPFLIFESAVLGPAARELTAEENSNEPSKMRRNILLYGTIFGGAGLYMAAGRCGNEGSTVCRVWAHWGPLGFGVGAGIGALVTVLAR